MGFFNPLHPVFETSHYKAARTLRTGFGGKLWDTFRAFTGDPTARTANKEFLGLFDYLTLGIPYGVGRLTHWLADYALDQEGNTKELELKQELGHPFFLRGLAAIALVFVGWPHLACEVIRYVLGFGFMLGTSLFTLAANIISWVFAYPHQKALDSLLVKSEIIQLAGAFVSLPVLALQKNKDSTQKTMDKVLQVKGLTLDDLTSLGIQCKPNADVFSSCYIQLCLTFATVKAVDTIYGIPIRTPILTANIDLDDENDPNIKPFQAILALNIAGLSSKLEKPVNRKVLTFFEHKLNGETLTDDDKQIMQQEISILSKCNP